MKRILQVIFTFVLTIFSLGAFAATFTAVQDGAWDQGATWGHAGNAVGVDYPGASDDAITNGWVITISSPAACRNLLVDPNRPSGVTFSSPLTITGSLIGWDNSIGFFSGPAVNVFSGNSIITFTAANFDGFAGFLFDNEVISNWNNNTPIVRANFNLQTGTTYSIDNDFFSSIAITQVFIFGNTSLKTSLVNFPISPAGTGLELGALAITSSTASFTSEVPIRNNTLPSSRVLSVSISGHLATSSYLNAMNFTLGAGSTFETSYFGTDQTEGWWYLSNRPTGGTISPTSTITFNSGNDQNVYARTYGNLTLDGAGTKTIPNSASLNVQGTLSINSSSITFSTLAATGITIGGSLINNGNFSPSQLVTFTGSTIATIGGSQSTNFAGGITVSKLTSSITMATATSITTSINNGITISSGTLNLGNVNTTLSGGNIDNSGIITSGNSGTLLIEGTSVLSGSGTYTLKNFNVKSTGDATFESDVIFTGTIVNTGSLSFSNSVDVTFTGGSLQTISGNAFSLYDMIVDKESSSLSNNASINLLGTLTITNGTFDVDGSGSGSFILNSDANGDARIGPMGGGSIIGNVTFERYFNNTVDNRYRNFAFPITGVTVEQLENFFTIVPGSFAWYRESVLGDYDQGWQIQNAGALTNGRAYTAGMYNIQPITISVTGQLLKNLPVNAQSPHNYGLTYTDDPAQDASQDGWNFVANPFASPIDWTSAAGWTKIGGIDANAAIWDAVLGAYRYTGGTWDGVVASGQSFWVHTTSSATLESTEEVKVNVADPIFYRKKTLDHKDRLLVKLEDDNAFDVAVIQYIEKATPEYDGAFDAYKLPNRIFNLSSLTPEGANLAVNALPRSFCTNNFRLNLTNIDPGSYKLSFENLTSFDNLDSLTLYDKFLDKSVRVSEGSIYNFDVTSDASSYGAERFELLFAYPDVAGFTPEISLDNRKLVSNFESGNQWILNGEIIPEETDNVLLPMASGEYQVLVSDGTCSVKSDAFKLDRIASRIHPNPATTHFIIDLTDASKDNPPKSGFIYLYSVTGQLILKERFTATDTELSVKVDGIAAGEYVVNLVVGDSKIVAKERLIIK